MIFKISYSPCNKHNVNNVYLPESQQFIATYKNKRKSTNHEVRLGNSKKKEHFHDKLARAQKALLLKLNRLKKAGKSIRNDIVMSVSHYLNF